jgi:hypothetical protein
MINIGGAVQQGEDPITERGDGRRRGVERGILPAGVSSSAIATGRVVRS